MSSLSKGSARYVAALHRYNDAIAAGYAIPFRTIEEVPMADEKVKVDMSKHQRPYARGPQVRKNLEEEFARLFPGEAAPGAGEERYEYMERKLRDRANQRKAEADD